MEENRKEEDIPTKRYEKEPFPVVKNPSTLQTNWRKETLKIKDLIPRYESEIDDGADELVIIPKYREMAAQRIEQSHEELYRYAAEFRKVITEAQFNRVIRNLYEECKLNSVLVE